MVYASGIDRARAALSRGASLPSAAIGRTIAGSWERCRQLGMDPGGRPEDVVVDRADLLHRRERFPLLRRLALAEMQLLHDQISGSNFMIAFADGDGVVLDTISDHRFASSADGRAIIPGSRWGEQDRGTNALGLALIERSSIAVYGREHFFESHVHLSCMAAPIFDAAGDVIGLLDASCNMEARQQHTHALVRMAAAQIENSVIYQARRDCLTLAFHPRAEYLDTLSAGLIALTADGLIGSINRAGRQLLAGLEARVGARFDDLFDLKLAPTIEAVVAGGVMRLRDRAGSLVLMVCRQLPSGISRHRGSPGLAGLMRSQPATPVTPTSGAGHEETAAGATLVDAAPGFVCDDPSLQSRIAKLPQVARLGLPVLIRGETGTGKELLARHVHTLTGRKGPFVPVNCGAIPESLFIAELFGHERGAFTNARPEGAQGLIRAADGGTLFLDEVADIPLAAQTALLRFLDSMEVRSVGSSQSRRVDVRIVSATNADLSAAASSGRFRLDLYFRLAGYEIEIPPLRERADFAAIVETLLRQIQADVTITDAAIEQLRLGRRWPGNVRELRSALQLAVLDLPGGFLDEDSFGVPLATAAAAVACPDCREQHLARQRCEAIRKTYQRNSGNIAETARELGISRTTVYKHIRNG